MTDNTTNKSTGSLLVDAMTNVSGLVRSEVDLARAEINENLTRAGIAIGLIVAAVIIALVSLHVLAAALVVALTEAGIDAGWSALIVGAFLAAVAFVLMGKGVNDLKLSSIAPSRAAKNVQQDAQAVKEAVQ